MAVYPSGLPSALRASIRPDGNTAGSHSSCSRNFYTYHLRLTENRPMRAYSTNMRLKYAMRAWLF